MATAATAGAVAMPFGPLAAGLAAAGGFVTSYLTSEWKDKSTCEPNHEYVLKLSTLSYPFFYWM